MKKLLGILVLGLFVGACTPIEKPTLKTEAATAVYANIYDCNQKKPEITCF